MPVSPIRFINLLCVFLMLSFATGCKEKVIEPSEADVTIAFFDAIYNQKSLQKTLALSSNSFKKEIEKYITIRNFSHRALSLHFDSVTINTQHAHTTVIDEFNIQVDMTVLITGIRDGKTYKEVKNIRLVKNNKTWLVDQLLKD